AVPGKAVTAVAFHPQATQYLTGGDDGAVRLWALPPAPPSTLDHPAPVLKAVPSPDGKKLYTASADGVLRSIDLVQKGVERSYGGHKKAVHALAVAGNGQLLATGDAEGTVRTWNPATGKEVDRIGAHAGAVHELSLLPAGNALLSTGADQAVRLWRLPV